MSHHFHDITFTPAVRARQAQRGSRASYARFEASAAQHNVMLSAQEAQFIAARDSFYMATVSETGWPYLQHRGGPQGFVKILGPQQVGFADYRGNRQYISVGNIETNGKVSLLFMDYPNRTRLKLLGHMRLVGQDELELLARLCDKAYGAKVERGLSITVEAFDWNCPSHITPRYSRAEWQALLSSA